MLLKMGAALRNEAQKVAEALVAEFPAVSGVCLFGSVARGDADAYSDIDLFVVGDDPKLTPSAMRRKLQLKNQPPKVSIVYHTPQTLHDYVRAGSRFLVHLQLEGQVLYDEDGLLRSLQARPPIKGSLEREIQGQLRRLELFDWPVRFNGNLLFPLAHVFASGKAIVMAILAENEIYEFNRNRAFDAFVEAFPQTTQDIEILRRLSAFAELVTKGGNVQLPFSYHHCEDELAEAIAAIRRLMSRITEIPHP